MNFLEGIAFSLRLSYHSGPHFHIHGNPTMIDIGYDVWVAFNRDQL